MYMWYMKLKAKNSPIFHFELVNEGHIIDISCVKPLQQPSVYCSVLKSTWIKVSTFHYSEPNNYLGGPEECVNIYVDRDGTWNDNLCDSPLSSICEMGHEVIW